LSLTAFRLLLGPAFLILHRGQAAVGPATVGWLILIVLLAMASDWLDGLTARRWNAVSPAGKLLDPFADALFCMLVFADFAQCGLVPLWMVAILIAREVLVTFVLRPTALWCGVVVPAGPLGKVKTAGQFVAMALVLLTLLPGMADVPGFRTLPLVTLLAVVGFSVASAAGYVRGVRAAFRGPRSDPAQSASRTGEAGE